MTLASRAMPPRAVLLDLARTLALVGMAVFHFNFDLVMFGYLPPEVIMVGFWPLWARVVASSFLILSGVGLYLAYGAGIDPRRLARRVLRIAGAAAVVSIGTRFAVGEQYVFWGILHMIAFGSLVGLLFLRLPAVVTLAVAAVVFWIGWSVALPAFDAAPLLFLGLGALRVTAVDYVPVFPWLAPVLVGVALGRTAVRTGIWARIASVTAAKGSLWDWLAMPGRYSLWVYLGHQPVLFGLLWVWTFWV
jgi:uncharacterized membrane protein